jgi:hypothetical protein
VLLVILGIAVFRDYGFMLFLAAPFVMGGVVGWSLHTLGAIESHERFESLVVAFSLAAALMLLVAAEGVVCLVMALPLAIPVAAFGVATGTAVAKAGVSRAGLMMGFILVPAGWGIEGTVRPAPPLHEVRSSIDIAAPPDAVWPHVLAFPPLTEPDEWWFQLGIAYPQQARIDGTGVGAIRYCEFSTGPFVEPITAWEPGRRLAFDVSAQPEPMRELSLWPGVHPPHLNGYLNSRRGEFRLIALPDGRTRLEGSTWYELDMAPGPYWRVITDKVIQSIHTRVLTHIKEETERRVLQARHAQAHPPPR